MKQHFEKVAQGILRTTRRLLHTTYYILPSFFVPLVAFATVTPPKDVNELIDRIGDFIVDPIIFTLFTIAFVVFIWGLVQFVANLSNEEARSTGQKHMVYGLIGMAIMVSVRGIIEKTIEQLGS